jgi:hypothetical protein
MKKALKVAGVTVFFGTAVSAVLGWTAFGHGTAGSNVCLGFCANGWNPSDWQSCTPFTQECCGVYHCEDRLRIVVCCDYGPGYTGCHYDFSNDPPTVSCYPSNP